MLHTVMLDQEIMETMETMTAPKISETIKIHKCAPWKKERILRFLRTQTVDAINKNLSNDFQIAHNEDVSYNMYPISINVLYVSNHCFTKGVLIGKLLMFSDFVLVKFLVFKKKSSIFFLDSISIARLFWGNL